MLGPFVVDLLNLWYRRERQVCIGNERAVEVVAIVIHHPSYLPAIIVGSLTFPPGPGKHSNPVG